MALKIRFVALVFVGLGLASAAEAQLGPAGPTATTAPAAKEGWWIRLNPGNQAARVYWRFGPAANQLGMPMMWVRGESPDAIDAPAAQRTLDRIHLAAIGMRPDAPVSFCLFFQDRGVSLIEFTQETIVQVNRNAEAPECTTETTGASGDQLGHSQVASPDETTDLAPRVVDDE